MRETVTVDTGHERYDILIGPGLLGDPAAWSDLPKAALAVVVTNTTVAPLYAQQVVQQLGQRYARVTQVPLPGLRSSLVWVVTPREAEDILALPAPVLDRTVEDRMQSMLGKTRVEGAPQAWPLSAMTARRFGTGRIALVGEAAHVFPPIGAQGLNLSLRDIETVLGLALDARRSHAGLAVGEAYDRRRRTDIVSRTAAIDLFNRSLLSGFLPVQMLRAAGLHMLSALPPLRYLAMNEGVAPGRGVSLLPAFLREEIRRKRA